MAGQIAQSDSATQARAWQVAGRTRAANSSRGPSPCKQIGQTATIWSQNARFGIDHQTALSMENRPCYAQAIEWPIQRDLFKYSSKFIGAAKGLQPNNLIHRGFKLNPINPDQQSQLSTFVSDLKRPQFHKRLILGKPQCDLMNALIIDHPPITFRLRDQTRTLSRNVVKFVAEPLAQTVDLNSAFNQKLGINIDTLGIGQQTQSLIGIHVSNGRPQSLTPNDCVTLVGLPTEIARGFHGRNVIGDHFTVAAKPTGRQHQGLAANIFDACVGPLHSNACYSPIFVGKKVDNVGVRQYVDALGFAAIDQPCHHISPGAFLDGMKPLSAMTKCGAPAKIQLENNPVLLRQPVQRYARRLSNGARRQRVSLCARLGHNVRQEQGGRIFNTMDMLLLGSRRAKRAQRHCTAACTGGPAFKDKWGGTGIKGGQGGCKSAGPAADNKHLNLDIKWPAGCDKNRHGSGPSPKIIPISRAFN